jgi:hypothetical protein
MQNDINTHFSDQKKVRCFGSSAALTIEASKLLHKGDPVGDTVNIDVAPRHGESVDWAKKITVQLGETELPIFASVLLGYLPAASFKRSTKGVEITRQANKLYIVASEGSGKRYSLPVPMAQCYLVSTLVLEQLEKLSGGLSPEFIIAGLRGASSLFVAESKLAPRNA